MIIRTAISAGSKHIIDDGLIGAEDEGRGRWIVIDGHVAVVTGFDPNTNRLSFAPDDPNPPNGETEYELWDQRYNPEHVNSLINQAITDAQVNGVYVPDTIDTAYLPPSAIRIDAPSEWEVVRSVERTFEARGYGIGRSYVDLLQSLESSDDAESDDTFYPFHTVKISGSHSFALTT